MRADETTPAPEDGPLDASLDGPPRARWQRALDVVLVAGFALATALPGVWFAVAPRAEEDVVEAIRVSEWRKPYPPARLTSWADLDRWPAGFELWYRDRAPWRTELLRARAWAHLFLLGEAPGEQMVLARDRWLFVDEGRFLDEARGAFPLHPELEAAWVEAFVARRDAAEALGMRYVLLLCPSKATIYPDRVPGRYVPVGPSQRTQLLPALRAAGVDALDLLPALQAEREHDDPARFDRVAHPLGTHWTTRGDRVVYEQLARHLGWEPLPRDRWIRQDLSEDRDSWATRLHLEGWMPEPRSHLQPRLGKPRRRRIEGMRISEVFGYLGPGSGGGPDAAGVADGVDPGGSPGPPVFLFHDSYARELRELLTWHRDVHSVWSLVWDPARLEASGAEVVIDVWVDRRILDNNPLVMHPPSRAFLAERFAAGAPLAFDGEAALARAVAGRDGRDLMLDGLPRLEEDAVLALRVRAPEGGLVQGLWPPERADTLAAFVAEGESTVHLGLRAFRQGDGVLGLRLPEGEGWEVLGVELRSTPSLTRPLGPDGAPRLGDPRRYGARLGLAE